MWKSLTDDKFSKYVTVARVQSPFGTNGSVRIKSELWSVELFKEGEKFFISPPLIQIHELEISEVFFSKKHLVIHFKEIGSKEEAKELVGRFLQVPSEKLAQVDRQQDFKMEIGFKVNFDDGKLVGNVQEIIFTRANKVYVIRTDHEELLIPAIVRLVKDIDKKRKEIIIDRKIYEKEFKL